MSRISGLIGFLSNDEMTSIHAGALHILEKAGVIIDHEDALDHLEQTGAIIDFAKRRAWFPTEVVENAVAKMRRSFELNSGGNKRAPMPICYTTLYFTTIPRSIHQNITISCGASPLNVLDLNRKRRRATLQDVRAGIRLADGLDHIDFIGPPCIAEEIPNEILPIVITAELVKNTSKPVGIEAWNRRQIN